MSPHHSLACDMPSHDLQVATGSSTLKPLVVLVGPTAIGKSRIALEVARALGTEIITADSTQVYRGMNIGTDTPPEADRRDVPHRVIDVVDPDEPFNAGEFRRHALPAIERLHTQGRLPLVVGGTGLYVRALLHGLWSAPPVDRALRRALEAEARVRGDEAMYQELSRADPDTARRLHPRDAVKVRRALEVYRQTGVPLSQAHQQHRGLGHAPSFRALVLGLTMERAMLYQRIDQRVNDELEKGLVDETRALLARGYSRNLVSMKSLGYRQMAGYLEGDYAFDEAVQRLKRDTRRYAKRQMTWFRKEPGLRWVEIQADEPASSVARRLMRLIEHFVDAPPPSPGRPGRPLVARSARGRQGPAFPWSSPPLDSRSTHCGNDGGGAPGAGSAHAGIPWSEPGAGVRGIRPLRGNPLTGIVDPHAGTTERY